LSTLALKAFGKQPRLGQSSQACSLAGQGTYSWHRWPNRVASGASGKLCAYRSLSL